MGASFFNGNFLKVLPTKGIELKDGTKIITGTGSPEGVETAPIGSWYTDTSNGDWYRKLSGTGNTGWVPNTFNLLQDGSFSAPSLAFASDTDTGFFRPGANRMGFVANGVQQAEVNTGGLYAPGHIVQSIYSSNSYQTSTTGTTYTDVLSALGVTWEIAITPKSAVSVIDLMANISVLMSRASATVYGGILIQRKIGAGSYSTIYTPVTDGNGPFDFGFQSVGASNAIWRDRQFINIRDTPATTSVVTYKFQFRNYFNDATPSFTINQDTTTDGQSFVFLNEVAV